MICKQMIYDKELIFGLCRNRCSIILGRSEIAVSIGVTAIIFAGTSAACGYNVLFLKADYLHFG